MEIIYTKPQTRLKGDGLSRRSETGTMLQTPIVRIPLPFTRQENPGSPAQVIIHIFLICRPLIFSIKPPNKLIRTECVFLIDFLLNKPQSPNQCITFCRFHTPNQFPKRHCTFFSHISKSARRHVRHHGSYFQMHQN